MLKIFKYPIPEISEAFEIPMPQHAKILTVQMQGTIPRPCIWALVEDIAAMETRHFAIYGTGHRIPDNYGVYIGTFQMFNGDLVWHLFAEYN